MNDLLEAKDELAVARDLIELIAMAVRKDPDSDERAVASGCHAALQHIGTVNALIDAHLEGAA